MASICENEFTEHHAGMTSNMLLSSNNLQQYSNIPLGECHKRGASMLICLYELGISGMLMDLDNIR